MNNKLAQIATSLRSHNTSGYLKSSYKHMRSSYKIRLSEFHATNMQALKGPYIKKGNSHMSKEQRIRDPLHNLIIFDEDQMGDLLWKLVQTRPFQRLRRIRQLGFSEFVYPGATHTRFAHSLGVMQTARSLLKVIEAHDSKAYSRPRAETALIAALLHDLGHGPFSHAFESVGDILGIKGAHHESLSQELILNSEVTEILEAYSGGMAKNVADLIDLKKYDIYSAVVSSQFDADRLDYMRRDRLMAGTQTGAIDFEWLMANLKVGEVPISVDDQLVGSKPAFVLGSKAIHAAETYVLGLFQLYPTIYFHKTTRSAEKMFTKLLLRLFELVRAGGSGLSKNTGLPTSHPLMKFAKNPDKIELSQNLDDTVIWGAIACMCDAEDEVITNLASRIRHRKLYKAVDIRPIVERDIAATVKDPEKLLLKIDVICGNIKDELKELEKTNELLVDSGDRSPYKKPKEATGNQTQIMVQTPTGLEDLGKHSRVVSAILPFKFLRAYYAEEDVKVKNMISAVIKSCIEKGKTE